MVVNGGREHVTDLEALARVRSFPWLPRPCSPNDILTAARTRWILIQHIDLFLCWMILNSKVVAGAGLFTSRCERKLGHNLIGSRQQLWYARGG